jgi:hypothetical protein
MSTRRRTSAPSALAQPEGFREWPLNRTGPSAGCRKKTPATAQARPFRAESSHEAIQAFGSAGVSDEAGLAKDYAGIRTCASLTVRTRCTTARSPNSNCKSTRTLLNDETPIRRTRSVQHIQSLRIILVPDPSSPRLNRRKWSKDVMNNVKMDEEFSGTKPIEEQQGGAFQVS